MIDSTFKNANILIVDDRKANIDILEGLLEELEYRNVKSETDPRKVAGLLVSFKPDLILLDLMMPFLSGFEVMEELNSLIPASTYLPILVLTADITPEAKKRALSGGAKDFLSKPFDLTEISLRIKNLLETRFLHQVLITQNQSLKAANEELEAFSYSVSHDLRTPLRHISSFISLLKEIQTLATEEETRFMDLISAGAREMDKLIEALLSLSRLNRAEFRKTAVNMGNLVNQAIKFFEPDIQHRNITFNIGQLCDCEGDEQLLKQAWINLISNAIKYTGKKAEAFIDMGSSCSNGEISYFIRDNGAGFDMKYAGKLFGVFKRLHKTGDFEGVGIGLANVNSIITRHGGRCSAEGEVDKGATFFFSLPIA
jgi:two-component system sensor histidine kinase/response regulator